MKRLYPFLFVIGVIACNNQPKEEMQSKPKVSQFEALNKYSDSVQGVIIADMQKEKDNIGKLKNAATLEADIKSVEKGISRLNALLLEIQAMPHNEFNKDEMDAYMFIMQKNLESQASLTAAVSKMKEVKVKIQK